MKIIKLPAEHTPMNLADDVECIYWDNGTHRLEFVSARELKTYYSEPGNISVGEIWIFIRSNVLD